MITPHIKVLPDSHAMALEVAQKVVAAASEAIDRFGRFSIVLAGGSTPKALYELLASDDFAHQIDWTKVHVYFGDERCVAADHPDSNYRMARLALFSEVPLPGDNIYRIRGEIEPEAAAIEYGKLLKEHFSEGGPDLTLLGMGEDGHTASLFPGTDALKETRHRCVAVYVEKLKSWRITLTPVFLNRSAEVIVMVAGANKAARVEQALLGGPDPQQLPIQLIAPQSGKMTWVMDVAAAGMNDLPE